jgi:hypothetical protein
LGDVWLVSSSTATLYRIDLRLGSIDHTDLGETAGRPSAEFGHIWVDLGGDSGNSVVVDPRTLYTNYLG